MVLASVQSLKNNLNGLQASVGKSSGPNNINGRLPGSCAG